MSNIERITYSTWKQFKNDFCTDIFNSSDFVPKKYLFRGQGNADWKLETSFDRMFKNIAPKDKNKIFSNMIEYFKQECFRNSSVDNISELQEYDVICLAQHYGIPTRLLDWTESPYVAAFFAFSNFVSLNNTTQNQYVSIWILTIDSNYWDENAGVMIVNNYNKANSRIKSQMGAFTLLKAPFNSLDEYYEYVTKGTSLSEKDLKQIIIPISEAKSALLDLDIMGINNSKMFPGIDGCAKTVVLKQMLSF